MNDAEMPKCCNDTNPVARKRHKCCECRGFIEPGEVYHRFTGVWDEPATFKQCNDCQILSEDFQKHESDYCVAFGYLIDAVQEFPEFWNRFKEILRKRNPEALEKIEKNERDCDEAKEVA